MWKSLFQEGALIFLPSTFRYYYVLTKFSKQSRMTEQCFCDASLCVMVSRLLCVRLMSLVSVCVHNVRGSVQDSTLDREGDSNGWLRFTCFPRSVCVSTRVQTGQRAQFTPSHHRRRQHKWVTAWGLTSLVFCLRRACKGVVWRYSGEVVDIWFLALTPCGGLWSHVAWRAPAYASFFQKFIKKGLFTRTINLHGDTCI